jgi:hypothetical protein
MQHAAAVAEAAAVVTVNAGALLRQLGSRRAHHVDARNEDSREALISDDLYYLALLAFVFAGHYLHLVAPHNLPAAGGPEHRLYRL